MTTHVTVQSLRHWRKATSPLRRSSSALLSRFDVARFDTGHHRRGHRASPDFLLRQLSLPLPLPDCQEVRS